VFGKNDGIVIGPEMHEEQVRRILNHVAVQRGDLNAAVSQAFQDRIDLRTQQYEVAGDGGLPGARGLKVNRNGRPE
jgi:hypothetical protein